MSHFYCIYDLAVMDFTLHIVFWLHTKASILKLTVKYAVKYNKSYGIIASRSKICRAPKRFALKIITLE